MKSTILTNDERAKLISMSTYWKEVRQREDITPLYHEVETVYRMIGTRILDILEEYIELTRDEVKE